MKQAKLYARRVAQLVAGGMSLAAAQAQAAVDVTAVVTEIGATLTPIGLVGSAVLILLVGIATFKWVRKAF